VTPRKGGKEKKRGGEYSHHQSRRGERREERLFLLPIKGLCLMLALREGKEKKGRSLRSGQSGRKGESIRSKRASSPSVKEKGGEKAPYFLIPLQTPLGKGKKGRGSSLVMIMQWGSGETVGYLD